ncbi:Calx-beta domain-containing protein [Cylindrospermopsis raciborskii]|uniref:Calx-beta domain-containing protein n=1 Tax=Cylindrospermopsis raciborskii CENA302 TaxID=1170768 RepID=A0A9Q5QZB7_9CYAN|nr:Calx-beta domain-containing protein [Cylindrospermopsis raciborskii]OPH11438.1 hypothetical protein CENA302_00235 [Cylindrospermopsis raciborskii CENA302]
MTKITNQALNSALNQLWVFSLSSDFWAVFDAVFGTEYNRKNAEILRSQWQIGDFSQLPEIEILDSSILGSANGAYSSSENRIYLSSNLMENGTSSKIREVLIEEIGHFVDSRINQIDTPGDEGEYFAGLVTDQKLNKDEIDRLKAENDSNWISVDGERLLIEQSSPGTVTRTPIAPASPGRTRYEVGNAYAFAALKSNGSVVTWGQSWAGGNSSVATYNPVTNNYNPVTNNYSYVSVASQLTSGVTQIFSNLEAFAALKSDGSVVTWGQSWAGGNSSVATYNPVTNNYSYVSVASQLTSGVSRIFSTGYAFAALKSDGSVVTWGDSSDGGNSSIATWNSTGNYSYVSVASQLTSGVTQIFSNWGAFAALKSDGSVVTWGQSWAGGNSSIATYNPVTNNYNPVTNNYSYVNVASQLTSGVTQIFSNWGAFAALKSDGSVVTWGDSSDGGNSSIATWNSTGNYSYVSVASQLTSGVTQIFSNGGAFAALKSDGSVVTWGDSLGGGNSSIATWNSTGNYSYVSVASQLTSGVTQIFSNGGGAFAALKSDGSVVTWGSSTSGGDSSIATYNPVTNNYSYVSVASQLTSGVTQIFSNGGAFAASGVPVPHPQIGGAFAALKSDGSVVTWGSSTSGGDSSIATYNPVTNNYSYVSVASQLTSGVTQIFSNGGGAFAALKSDGSVVTWGSSTSGGDSSVATYNPVTNNYSYVSVANQLTSGVVSFADPFNDDRLVLSTSESSVTLAVSPSSVTEDGSSNLVYTFTRTGVISNALTVNYTVGGTATNGTDYGNIGTSVTFAANSATATVTVDPTADTTVESDETVSLTLASGNGYTIGTITAVTGIVINDDKINTPPVLENLTFTGVEDKILNFVISDNNSQYRDDDNNDLAAVKVVSLPSFGSLTFVNGQPISLNQRVSAVELLNVRYNPNANVNGQDTFNITAIDNGTPEAESGQAKVTINVTPVNDAPEFTLTGNIQALTGAVDQTVTGFAQNISAGPNESSQKFEFITTVTSGNEIFTKLPSIDVTGNLTYSLSKTPGTAAVKVLLKDDGGVANSGLDTTEKEFTVQSAIPLNPSESSVTLAVSPSSVTEDGSSNLVYTFTRTGVISNALTVNYTVGGTATNGTDYGNIGTSVTFAANSATATVTVDPTADTTVESDETVSLTLASGNGYTIGTITAVTGIVINDDKINTPPVLENLTFTGVEDKILNFVISDNNSQYRDDDNNDLAAVKVVSLPSFGSLTFVNGQPISLNQRVSAVELLNVRYNPNANVNGQDTFNITAIDNGTPEAESGQAKVTINVTPVNDAPEFTLTGNIQALTGAVDQTVTGFAQNISAGPNESSQKFEFITTVTSGNEIFTKLPSIDVTGNLTYSLSKTPGTAAVKVLLKDDGGVANSGLDTTEKEFTVQSAIPLNPSVFEPNVDISAGLTFKPQTNGTVNLDTSRGSASLDQVQSVQSGTKSNFNHIIGLYEVMNNQGEIKDNQGNTLKPEDANYTLHALTTARVKNFTLQAGGNDTPSTATQLGSGVSVLGGKFYAPFAIANGGTYFPGNQGIEDFVAAEQGDINRFSTALPYVRDLVAREGKNGDVFNNAPRFVQEPVAYFTFGAANPDKSAHFRSYGNGVYGFEDLPADLTQYSNNDFNDAVFALKLTT